MLRYRRAIRVLLLAALWLPGKLNAQEPKQRASEEILEAIEAVAVADGTAEALRRLDAFIANLPPGDRVLGWEVTAGERERIVNAWKVGRTICFPVSRRSAIKVLDAATGRVLASVPLKGFGDADGLWVTPSARPGEFVISDYDKFAIAQTRPGQTGETIRGPFDHRIAPVTFENDLVFVPGRRARALVRTDRKGKTIWRCKLPGWTIGMRLTK